MTWRKDAQCAGQPLSDFVLDTGVGRVPARQRRDQARRLCVGCPVVGECAADALEFEDRGVVRGGVWIPSPGHPGNQALPTAVNALRDVASRKLVEVAA